MINYFDSQFAFAVANGEKRRGLYAVRVQSRKDGSRAVAWTIGREGGHHAFMKAGEWVRGLILRSSDHRKEMDGDDGCWDTICFGSFESDISPGYVR